MSLFTHEHPQVVAHVKATAQSDRAITIITIEEQLRGWFTQVRKARDATRLTRAYQGLFQVVDMAKTLPVLPFSSTAIDRYLELRKSLPRLGKHDLAIASIALDFEAKVVTRNRQDFGQIPNLEVEDWSTSFPDTE
ncbi:MAG: type II toxin-antitoxin system VapC family toxin [Planctomycetota bacterium]|nr:type II toxin-antitoxin system VapC family toxin [Planctomycetota bacterium]